MIDLIQSVFMRQKHHDLETQIDFLRGEIEELKKIVLENKEEKINKIIKRVKNFNKN